MNGYTDFELYEIYRRFTDERYNDRLQALMVFMGTGNKAQAKKKLREFDERFEREYGTQLEKERRHKPTNEKPIIATVDGVSTRYPNMVEACRALGISDTSIYKCLRWGTPTPSGITFSRETEGE